MVHILERTEDVTMLPHTRFNLFMGTILDIGNIFSHRNTHPSMRTFELTDNPLARSF